MHWGVSYYPELVDEGEWPRDLANMRAAGLSVLRILDFAWTAIEPREGCYAWGWLDRFIALAAEHGLRLVLCTPTATPPPWLATQYPEIMIENRDGSRRQLGSRRNADVDSEIYRHFAAGIATALGQRYGAHPAVLGWQIDNELLGPEGVSPECHSRSSQWRYRAHLKRRYGSVEELNRRWGLRFWNQEIADWGEIGTPRNDRTCLGHWLDYQEWFSASQRDFIGVQAAALRAAIGPGQWISTNATAIFDRGLDHLAMGGPLDVLGWDAYPGAAAGSAGRHHAAFTALAHDLFRSGRRRPFWVFETAALDAAITPAFCAEAAARGAAGIIFWHWRPHRAHVESGGVAVCDLAGVPIAERLERLQRLRARPELAALPGPFPQQPTAFLFDPANVRAEMAPNPYARPPAVPYLHAVGAMYRACWEGGLMVDAVRPGDPLAGFRLLVAPAPQHLGRDAAAAIAAFVRGGGTLLACAPLARRDELGTCYDQPGGPLAEVIGYRQRWEEAVAGEQWLRWDDGVMTSARPVLERIPAGTGEALATFVGGPCDGLPACIRRRHGAGTVICLATMGDAAVQRALVPAAAAAGLALAVAGHADLAVIPDLAGRGTWYANHGTAAVEVAGIQVPAQDFRLI